jgi:hypothetical protein
MNKTYILQKDMPFVKAGTEYIKASMHIVNDNTSYVPNKMGMKHERFAIHSDWVEDNLEWFLEKTEVRNTVTHIIPIHESNELRVYISSSADDISSERLRGIAVAVERELNNESITFNNGILSVPLDMTTDTTTLEGKEWVVTKVIDSTRGVIPIGTTGLFDYKYVKGEPIHSVIRTRDMQTFSIGDRLKEMDCCDTIVGFLHGGKLGAGHQEDDLWIVTNEKKGWGCTIDVAEKRPILFKTNDGIDITEGDEYYVIKNWDWDLSGIVKEIAFKSDNAKLTFSNKKSAVSYLINNWLEPLTTNNSKCKWK